MEGGKVEGGRWKVEGGRKVAGGERKEQQTLISTVYAEQRRGGGRTMISDHSTDTHPHHVHAATTITTPARKREGQLVARWR